MKIIFSCVYFVVLFSSFSRDWKKLFIIEMDICNYFANRRIYLQMLWCEWGMPEEQSCCFLSSVCRLSHRDININRVKWSVWSDEVKSGNRWWCTLLYFGLSCIAKTVGETLILHTILQIQRKLSISWITQYLWVPTHLHSLFCAKKTVLLVVIKEIF